MHSAIRTSKPPSSDAVVWSGSQRGRSPSFAAMPPPRMHSVTHTPGPFEPVRCPPDDLLLERDPELASPRPALRRTVHRQLVRRQRAAERRGRGRQDHRAARRRSTGGPPHRLAVGHLRADAVADAFGTAGRLARSHAARARRCGACGAPCRRRALGRALDAARSDPTHRPGGRRCAVGRWRDARSVALPGPAHRKHERAAHPELSRRLARQRSPAAGRALGAAGAQLRPPGAVALVARRRRRDGAASRPQRARPLRRDAGQPVLRHRAAGRRPAKPAGLGARRGPGARRAAAARGARGDRAGQRLADADRSRGAGCGGRRCPGVHRRVHRRRAVGAGRRRAALSP